MKNEERRQRFRQVLEEMIKAAKKEDYPKINLYPPKGIARIKKNFTSYCYESKDKKR